MNAPFFLQALFAELHMTRIKIALALAKRFGLSMKSLITLLGTTERPLHPVSS